MRVMSSDIKPIFAWEFISILGNSANMDLIRQAKGVPLAPTPTLETNKQTIQIHWTPLKHRFLLKL